MDSNQDSWSLESVNGCLIGKSGPSKGLLALSPVRGVLQQGGRTSQSYELTRHRDEIADSESQSVFDIMEKRLKGHLIPMRKEWCRTLEGCVCDVLNKSGRCQPSCQF